jgi:hypothetical protein
MKRRIEGHYAEYLQSEHWQEVRRQYRASRKLPQTCVVCGNQRVDLHHLTYRRIGRERLTDLVPLCREHHDEAHEIRSKARAAGQKPTQRLATARQLAYIRKLGGNVRAEMTFREARKTYERLARKKRKGARLIDH